MASVISRNGGCGLRTAVASTTSNRSRRQRPGRASLTRACTVASSTDRAPAGSAPPTCRCALTNARSRAGSSRNSKACHEARSTAVQPALRRQERRAVPRLARTPSVAANREPAVPDDAPGGRRREAAPEPLGQPAGGRLPVEGAQAGEQGVVETPLHRFQRGLGLGDVGDEPFGSWRQIGLGLRRLRAGQGGSGRQRQPSGHDERAARREGSHRSAGSIQAPAPRPATTPGAL